MKKLILLFPITLSLLLTSLSGDQESSKEGNVDKDELVKFKVPKGWPNPTYSFDKNPLTKNGIDLGRHLFYEVGLSRDSSVNCASCHLSYTNFTHIDHKVSHGIEDRIGTRNTLSIMNPAWQENFMWDGGVTHLDVQPIAPLTSEIEMDLSVAKAVERLRSSHKYKEKFKNAFGDSAEISGYYMFRALSQFMLTFNTYNSKYDKVMREEPGFTFSEREQKGLEVFRANCATCHKEPLFTDGSFRNNGLSLNPRFNDGGRIKITSKPEDSLKFRVPSLRNIEVSYPYMHDGRFKNLPTILFHYTNGIEESPTLDPQLKGGLKLTEDEKRNLVIFLKTLTDEEFLRNKDFTFPRDKK